MVEPTEIVLQFIELNLSGLYVLAGWSIFWLLLSSLAFFSITGKVQHHFWIMNFFWSLVNIVIAVIGYFTVINFEVNSFNEFVFKYQKTSGLYALNAGLDIGYIGFALFLSERSRNVEFKKALMYKGFSTAIILQALFLFLFDSAMILINQFWLRATLAV
jgi:F0F1-type ATP synthase membrane subunit c/vacuolar-type H+-ATPase subunit K